MDKVQENWFPSQHPYTVWVKYNLQSAILLSSFGSDGWYRRYPTVKIGYTSKTSNGTENERNFQIGINSYTELKQLKT